MNLASLDSLDYSRREAGGVSSVEWSDELAIVGAFIWRAYGSWADDR